MTETERMEKGLLYICEDDDIMERQIKCLEKLYDFNATRPSELEKRGKMLKDMLAEAGEGCYVEPPLHANWGGAHVHFGSHVYANFSLTLVDDGHIYVGNDVMFGPNVTVATAGHPVCPELREKGYQYNADVHIGNNVWIGAGAVIVPGITIGDHAVIGAGSVVTRDIPANSVAYGNPCRVARQINSRDYEYYFKDMKIDIKIK